MFSYGYQIEGETVSLWKLRAIFWTALYLRRIDGGIYVGRVFSSSFRRQQQERQGQPGVFLLWLHRLLCGPCSDRSGDAHFQGCSTRPSVFGACVSRNPNHAGPHKRRNFRAVQVSLYILYFSSIAFLLLSQLVESSKIESRIQFVSKFSRAKVVLSTWSNTV